MQLNKFRFYFINLFSTKSQPLSQTKESSVYKSNCTESFGRRFEYFENNIYIHREKLTEIAVYLTQKKTSFTLNRMDNAHTQ